MPDRNIAPRTTSRIAVINMVQALLRLAIPVVFSLGLAGPGAGGPLIPPASVSPSSICDSSARRASRQTGVPFDVLRAVSRTETGRGAGSSLEPWPWTVNMEGKGKWFADRDSARRYAYEHFKDGARSFDIGCFQINYRWHNQAFRSIDEMFDPRKNALYAAQYLRQLFDEFGDWPGAVGAFHSRTPARAGSYVARYNRILAALQNAPAPMEAQPAHGFSTFLSDRQPLLIAFAETTGQAGPARSRGSLVPLSIGLPAGSRPLIALNTERN